MQRWATKAWGIVAAVAAAAVLSTRAEDIRPSASGRDTYSQRVQPLLKKYCFECHGGAKAMGEVRLDQ